MTHPSLVPAPVDVSLTVPNMTDDEVARGERCRRGIAAVLEAERYTIAAVPVCTPEGTLTAEARLVPLRLQLATARNPGLNGDGGGNGGSRFSRLP